MYGLLPMKIQSQDLKHGALFSALRLHWSLEQVLCLCGSLGNFLVSSAAGACRLYVLSMIRSAVHSSNVNAGETISAEYKLEYGTDKIEMHVGAVKEGQRVLLVDDLIATGGTLAAGISLMEKARLVTVLLWCLHSLVHVCQLNVGQPDSGRSSCCGGSLRH